MNLFLVPIALSCIALIWLTVRLLEPWLDNWGGKGR